MKKTHLIALLLISPLFLNTAFAHQSDSVGDYRIEIDWKNKPIVTGESNAIIVYVSLMDKSKEAADQPFNSNTGVEGLKKTLKIKLMLKKNQLLYHYNQLTFQENTSLQLLLRFLVGLN